MDPEHTLDMSGSKGLIIAPDIEAPLLTRRVSGVNHDGEKQEISVIEERPLTIFLNATEILTAMTIGDYPEYLALGFLFNQGMITDIDAVTGIDRDDELGVVVVRTAEQTGHEDRMAKRIRTSGCAMGTVFGDLADQVVKITLADTNVKVSWLFSLARTINMTPSLYLAAGAIHGTVLCHQDRPLVYMEDVGRHNAVDKIAGWMKSNRVHAHDKILYTTGRLTSEMILKTIMMEIPALVSRSGFTAWGVDIARSAGLTLIGRMRGKRYICLAGHERLIVDMDGNEVEDEHPRHRRKGSLQHG